MWLQVQHIGLIVKGIVLKRKLRKYMNLVLQLCQSYQQVVIDSHI